MRPTENIELKKYFKKVFENQEFETSFQDKDIEYNHEEDLLEEVYEEYTFKYYMEVGKVLGGGTKTVASINVIITEFTVDGEDKMFVWKEDEYAENVWYIAELGNMMHEETFRYYPISIYLTFYGYDEYENLPLDQKNL